jgi:hypothetical protein
MAFVDYDAYLATLGQNAVADFQSASFITTATRIGDLSRVMLPSPTTPTTSVVLDRNSDRALNAAVPNAASGNRMSILGARISAAGAGGIALTVVDMLNISGGLNATLTTSQTTNLPTAALTRYTSGDGVHAALVVHVGIGGTATTVTCSYTNQAGTSGRTTPAVAVGGSGLNVASLLIRLPLQSGDTGFRSVESVTLAGSTGTAGNFGVVLFKPLALVMANDVEGANVMDNVSSGRMVGQFAEVLDNACLNLFASMTVGQVLNGAILLGEA